VTRRPPGFVRFRYWREMAQMDRLLRAMVRQLKTKDEGGSLRDRFSSW
jgi:hypothetical protein